MNDAQEAISQELQTAHDRIKELENTIKELQKANNQWQVENIRQIAISGAYRQLITDLFFKS